ncbi:unnamed protein product [Vitrella brassicaformis CCMP3155]|uniref:F-box domain-containing protein n=1 Tax=Vitrella brassicaformis (strain CCMP3155) TaxID=1169540 RepID=A0A0G4ETP3_VITBC|nr:unnamed protein product [Vitrella brassicaformis CCMP3155]|eukprot:CEM01619.1 unnamed protein product [Vitrella brassicaformis CCMP3155]
MATRSLTSLLDGLIWLNVSSYQSVKERLAMSCVCRPFYWAIYSLIRVINWHRPNHGLSCRGPDGSLVTFEQQQHAIILLPGEEEVEEIGRARLFAFISLQLVNHTDTLKDIQTAQPKSKDRKGGLSLAHVKGPDAVFPSVTSVKVDSPDGLHLFRQQKLVCPALERLTGKVFSDDEIEDTERNLPGKWASICAVLDGSLAFIIGSSPSLTQLDIFPLLCCTDFNRVNQSCVVPLTTAALSSLKNLRHVGHLKLRGLRTQETTLLVTLLRQLTPHKGSRPRPAAQVRPLPPAPPRWEPPPSATSRSTAPFASSET